MMVFAARSITETFFFSKWHISASFYMVYHQSACVTYRISRVMTRHEVNMEGQDVTSHHGVNIVFVILVLISPTLVGVAVVAVIYSIHGVLNGAGKIYRRDVISPPIPNILLL